MLVEYVRGARRSCGRALSCPIRPWKYHPSTVQKTHQPSSSSPPCHYLELPSLPEIVADLSGPPKPRLGGELGVHLSNMKQNWGWSPTHGRWEDTACRRLGEGWCLLHLSLILYSSHKDHCREPMAEGIVGARPLRVRRIGVHGSARRQPARLELAARRAGLRPAHRRHDRDAVARTDATASRPASTARVAGPRP